MAVHLLCIVSISAIRKRIVRRRCNGCSGEVAVKETRALLGDERQPGPASCTSETSQSIPLQHGQCNETVESEDKFLGAWPAHTARAANAENLHGSTDNNGTSQNQNHSIRISLLYDSFMPVSFGNSAMNDLYTADTPLA